MIPSSAIGVLPREVPVSNRRAPPVPSAVKDRAKRSLAQWVELARQRYNRPLFMPTISFDLVGTTAGRAHQDKRHVQLNAVLLTENLDEFEKQIIPHELAHLLVMHLYGFSGGHGDEWKHTMRRLGLTPDRTHSLDVTNARTVPRMSGYACGCGPCEISTKMHNKIRRGAKFTCQKCRKRLHWTGVPGGAGTVAPVARPVARPATPYPSRTPTPSPTPSPRPTPGARTPSDSMLRFADSLAKKHGMALPADAKVDFEACRQFLDKWSKASVIPRLAAPAPVPTPAPAPTRPPVVEEGPTERQLAYALSIAARKALTIPGNTLQSKRAISAWIDKHK